MPILGQLPDPASAQAVGWILLSLAAACVAINSIAGFWKTHVREQPSPSDTYATKREHSALADKMDVELGRERSSRKKMHEEVAAIQGDIKAMRSDAESRALQLGDLKRQIEGLNQRIDEVPRRTIGLLRETKQLHT